MVHQPVLPAFKQLKPGGRCACIVPDGVLFGSSKAHQQLRQTLAEEQKLDAVISMPSGVFKPYAGSFHCDSYFHPYPILVAQIRSGFTICRPMA